MKQSKVAIVAVLLLILIAGVNTAVFAAMLDYINRDNRKVEPRRMEYVMNNHIIRGGHLSAQPMGALNNLSLIHI